MNRAEFDTLIERHYRQHFRSMVKKLGNAVGGPANAEDVVQEAYTRAITYYSAFNGEDFEQWFSGILRNCIAQFRKEEQARGAVNIEEVEDEPSIFEDPFFRSIKNEIEARIAAKPASQSHILRLHFLEQYSPSDIERVVPETNGAIRQIIFRFRNELRGTYA